MKSPDARLLALGKRFEAACAAFDALDDEAAPVLGNDRAERAFERKTERLSNECDALAEKIIAAIAVTPAGLAVKATVALYVCRPDSGSIEDRAMRSLVASAYYVAL